MGYKATGSGSAQASNRTRLGWALPFALGMSSAAATDWRELLQHADELNAGGQHQKAADHYATILDQPQPQLSPHMAERIRLRLANSQMAAGNFASARASLQPLMRQSGANLAEARALGAQVIELESESSRLRVSGLEQIAADADSPWGYRDLAHGLKLQNRLNEAFAVIEGAQASAVDPAQALALIEAVNSIGAPRAAIDLASAWLQAQPTDQAVRNALLRLAVDHAPLPQTLAIFEASLPLLAHPALPRYLLAQRLAMELQPEQALAQFRLLLTDPVLGLDCHLAAAALLTQTGDPTAAAAMLRRAIEIWPQAAPGDPRRRGASRSPYTELIRQAQREGGLDRIEQDWPALRGVNGTLIRANLALARSYQGLPLQPEPPPSRISTPD